MDSRKIVAVIGAIILLGFATCPILLGEVNLVDFWRLIVVTAIGGAISLLVWGWKPDLEKPRFKIKSVVKPQTTYSGARAL